jgi:hypothetical protein
VIGITRLKVVSLKALAHTVAALIMERSTISCTAQFLTVMRKKRTIFRACLIHWILKVQSSRSHC